MKKHLFLFLVLLATFSVNTFAEITAKAMITIEANISHVNTIFYMFEDPVDGGPYHKDNSLYVTHTANRFSINFYTTMGNDKYGCVYLSSLSDLVLTFEGNAVETEYTITFDKVVGNIVLVGENDTIVANNSTSYVLKCEQSAKLQFVVNPRPHYDRVVEPNMWSTICLPREITDVDGAAIYEFIGRTDTLVVADTVFDLPLMAGKAYLFKATDSIQKFYYNDTTVEAVCPIQNCGLIGTFVDMCLTDAAWELDNTTVKPADAGTYVPANRAYINIDDIIMLDPEEELSGSQYAYFTIASFSTPTALNSPKSKVECQKIMLDGRMYIQRGGKVYNAQGGVIE